jgi:hypothetical protein
MRVAGIILVAVMAVGAAPATRPSDIDAHKVEAAKARLAQRAAARSADDNSPSSLTKAQEAALRKELDDLRAEVKRLRAGKVKLEDAAAKAVSPPLAFRTALRNYEMSAKPAERRSIAESNRKLETKIVGYLQTHTVTAEVEKAIWGCHPVVGMDSDALAIFPGKVTETGQVRHTKELFFQGGMPFGGNYELTMVDGVVTSCVPVQNPYAEPRDARTFAVPQ